MWRFEKWFVLETSDKARLYKCEKDNYGDSFSWKMLKFLKQNKTWSLVSNSILGSLQFRSSVSLSKGNLTSEIIYHCLSSKVVFNQRLSSMKSHLPSMVIFHQRCLTIKSRFPWKGISQQRASPIKGHLYIKCCLPSQVNFHQRMFSIKGFLQSKAIFH